MFFQKRDWMKHYHLFFYFNSVIHAIRKYRISQALLINLISFLDAVDGYEFYIVSLDNKQWHFEAGSCEERDEWVTAIEQQILTSLQSNESSKKSGCSNNGTEQASIQSIRARVSGNTTCVDCDAPSK